MAALWGSRWRLFPALFRVTVNSQAAGTEATGHQSPAQTSTRMGTPCAPEIQHCGASSAPELCIQAYLPSGSLQQTTEASMCLSTTWVPGNWRRGFSAWEKSDTQVSNLQPFVFKD